MTEGERAAIIERSRALPRGAEPEARRSAAAAHAGGAGRKQDGNSQLAAARTAEQGAELMEPIKTDIVAVHRHSSHHRAEIEASGKCGCFCCSTVFDPSAINCWTDDGQALCPSCRVNAALGDESGYSVTSQQWLARLFVDWFGDPANYPQLTPEEQEICITWRRHIPPPRSAIARGPIPPRASVSRKAVAQRTFVAAGDGGERFSWASG
jgi:hypothetical protein